MTTTTKLAVSGAVALLVGFVCMFALHQLGLSYLETHSTGGPWTHSMTPGWVMALGPLTMALWFGGVTSLAVAFVRSVSKKPA